MKTRHASCLDCEKTKIYYHLNEHNKLKEVSTNKEAMAINVILSSIPAVLQLTERKHQP